jgi:hypothetical protein
MAVQGIYLHAFLRADVTGWGIPRPHLLPVTSVTVIENQKPILANAPKLLLHAYIFYLVLAAT